MGAAVMLSPPRALPPPRSPVLILNLFSSASRRRGEYSFWQTPWPKSTKLVVGYRAPDATCPCTSIAYNWQPVCNSTGNRHPVSGGKRRKKMKTKLMILAFLAAGSLLAQPRFYAGVRFGYAPAPVAVVAAPPAPLVSYVPAVPRPGSEATGIPPVRTMPGMQDIGLAPLSPAPAGTPRAIMAATTTAAIGAAKPRNSLQIRAACACRGPKNPRL
jgi:hypothetical protein